MDEPDGDRDNSYVYDSDALRDALSAVEAWSGDELSTLFALETVPDDTDGSLLDARTPYKRSLRATRKREALVLQNKILRLQHTIECERARRATGAVVDSGDALVLATAWRAVAVSQADERTISLVENEMLRLELASRLRGARKIVRLGERVAQLQQILPAEIPTISLDEYRGPHEDPRDQLARLTHKLEHEAREVFSAVVFRTQDRESFREIRFRSCDPSSLDGVEMEYVMGWVLPFTLHEVADALWVQATRPPPPLNKATRVWDLHDEPGAKVSRFFSPPQDGQTESCTHGQTATTWRIVKDETTDAGASFVELVTNIQARVYNAKRGGLVLNGYEWMRVERVEMTSSSEPLSRVKWCHRMCVCPPTYASMTHDDRTAWIHRVVTGPVRNRVEQDLERNIQNIENLLLTPRSLPVVGRPEEEGSGE